MTTKRHSPEEIVKKFRDADAMRSAGPNLAAVLQAREVGEGTERGGRNQHERMKSDASD
jgi:hypothetical protein